MDSDEDTSNDNWSDAEDSEGHESEWTDDCDESASDCSSSSHDTDELSDDEKERCKAKRARLAFEEYAESTPHCILPIGMGSIFWEYFGFPVWSDGECLTRKYVTCSFCFKMFGIDSQKVIPKMRSHLQHCNKEIYRVVAEQCLKTPLVELNKIPNVLLTSTQAHGMRKWLMKKRDSQHKTASPKNKAGKKARIQSAMFVVAVENLRVGMMNTDNDSSTCSLIKMLLALSGNGTGKPADSEMPQMTAEIFSAMLLEKYKEAKAKVIAAQKLCSEYSMCVEEWIDTENTIFLTFSVNYIKAGDLKNSVLLTVPKNLDEIPLTFEKLTNDLGFDLNKVTALITNSDIRFADFWKSEAQPQFLPCFFEVITVAIRDHLFDLSYVKALLGKLGFTMWPYCDLQVVLTRFEECLDTDQLTPKEKVLFQKIIQVLSSLRVAMDTVKFDRPAALISIVWPMLAKLQTEFLLPDPHKDDEQVMEMKKVLMDHLMAAYKQSLPFIQSATLLDPRFRYLFYACYGKINLTKFCTFNNFQSYR